MIYRELGKTGRQVSAIGFGGMRFRDIDNRDECCATLERAVALGINYFDTAPDYFAGKSEERFGEGLQGKKVLLSTKSGAATAAGLRRELEESLVRLRRSHLDIFHIWYVLSLEDYQRRKQGGAIRAALQAKAEGLVGEVFISTHMDGPAIERALADDCYAGVTLGFSAINAPFRLAAIAAARRRGLAVVCMNPLGGGLIPRYPARFANLQGPEDRNVVEAALRYILSTVGVSMALVGMRDAADVEGAAAAVDPFVPWTAARREQLHRTLNRNFDRLCTGCRYCRDCPAGLEIPKMMLTYNLKVLGEPDAALRDSMGGEWNLPLAHAAECTACGACEKRCPQKLPIIESLKYIAGL
jgi:predicted aldo/keto reductase-like oxidoreductase